jgi:hypothetical protein
MHRVVGVDPGTQPVEMYHVATFPELPGPLSQSSSIEIVYAVNGLLG